MRHHLTDPTTGRKLYAASPEDSTTPLCGFCGDVEVSDEGETCAACLSQQEEKAAENNDPEGFYADAQVDQDRLEGVRP